jgi:hypothetical protein
VVERERGGGFRLCSAGAITRGWRHEGCPHRGRRVSPPRRLERAGRGSRERRGGREMGAGLGSRWMGRARLTLRELRALQQSPTPWRATVAMAVASAR